MGETEVVLNGWRGRRRRRRGEEEEEGRRRRNVDGSGGICCRKGCGLSWLLLQRQACGVRVGRVGSELAKKRHD